MKVAGCRNLFLYDCNPGSPLHWAYKIFIRKEQFLNNEPLVKPELYASMILNPDDNRENLPDDYIGDILDAMPGKQRDRFKLGLGVKAEGVIYEKFDEGMILNDEALPESFDRYVSGQDFGLNITNVMVGIKNDCVYVLRDYGAFNMTTKSFNNELHERHWFDEEFPVYCDPAGGERIQEITNGIKANNSVDSGIDSSGGFHTPPLGAKQGVWNPDCNHLWNTTTLWLAAGLLIISTRRWNGASSL
jgi:hypothetical protein